MRIRRASDLALLSSFASLAAFPALAASGDEVSAGFYAGFIHPLSGIDHLLAMVAIGMWGAFLGSPLIWALPVAFPLIMVVGGIIGIEGIPLPLVQPIIALSVITLGLAICLAWRASIIPAMAIVSVFAIFHGHAHGVELPGAVAPEAYAIGFVLCTGLLHLTGIGIGLATGVHRGTVVLRSAGGAIAGAGVWILFGMPGFA